MGIDASDTPQPSGSLFFGGTMDLSKGFYLLGKFKFSLELLKKDNTTPYTPLLNALRILSSSLVEINLGVDIMKWF